MLAQGKSKANRGPGAALKWGLLGLLGLLLVIVAWKLVSSAVRLATPQYDLVGRWRAEQTTIMDASLPVGPMLEFTNNSATVMQSQVPVTAYDREGDRVHVVVPGGSGVEVSFTFRFEGPDRIVYEGPLGISARYRRIKTVQ